MILSNTDLDSWYVEYIHRLNMKVDLQSLFELDVQYTKALLVSKDRHISL
jgi:hypothetical protein